MATLAFSATLITGGVWLAALHLSAIDLKLGRIARALEERNRRG